MQQVHRTVIFIITIELIVLLLHIKNMGLNVTVMSRMAMLCYSAIDVIIMILIIKVLIATYTSFTSGIILHEGRRYNNSFLWELE